MLKHYTYILNNIKLLEEVFQKIKILFKDLTTTNNAI